ncbi:MAG: sialate O-acetylesterase, partial [Planctomycetaceae bacterium]
GTPITCLVDEGKSMNSSFLRWFTGAALTVLVFLVPDAASGELTLTSLFTDNAVLQQGMPVPVWGKADPGSVVTVEFAEQNKTAVADSNGDWRVVLAPLKASSQPRAMSVVSSRSNKQQTFNNLLVGEVWICSGQSNMQMGVNTVPGVKALLPGSRNIRSFTVRQTVSFREENKCSGQWVQQHPNSAVAFAFASFLEQKADVPVGIIQSCWGSSSIEGWMPRDMTTKLPHFNKIMQVFDADKEKRTRIESIISKPKWDRRSDIFLRTQPNVIYNAMMHPLAPIACRGIVWYQGEANGNNIPSMLQYGKTLPAWIERYREEWGRDDLHFLLVMLPGYARGLKGQAANPNAKSWAWMRQSQMKALDLPHTSIANTIDLGDANNIHPKDKLPIGKRLALLAARDAMGIKTEAHGPMMTRVEKNENKLVVHFDHAAGLKTIDEKLPTGFWVADDSKKWVAADATLNDECVIVSSPKLDKPKYVRYAFSGKPNVNLINEAGLPASPFRTDTFQP